MREASFSNVDCLDCQCLSVLQSRRNLTSGQIPAMNPLDEAAKSSLAHTPAVPSARDDYAIAAPLQVVVDTQEGMMEPH